jgi:hypothetical protein
MKATLDEARAAKDDCLRVFGELAGDVAVGITRLDHDSYGLKVNLTNPPNEGVSLPSQVHGVPVQVEVVGRIRKRK